MKHKIIAILGALIVLELALLLPRGIDKAGGVSLEEYAQEVVSICAEAKYRPSCYDEEVPKLMDYISMEDAFKVTSIVQSMDPSFIYCHVLGHELSAREVRKDPSKWKDVITRAPSGLCSNGGQHGAFQERFRAEHLSSDEVEAIKPELMDICEPRGTWKPTGLEQASCYHALGHLTMYITNAEIDYALRLCDDLAIKPNGRSYSAVCYDGVFMQIHQPLEPEDFALIEGKEIKKEELESFCSKYTGQVKVSCWIEGHPLFRDELAKPQGLTDFCERTDPLGLWRCYEGLIYVKTVQLNFDANQIVPYCKGLNEEWRSPCVASAASRLIETDYRNIEKAVSLCGSAADFDPKGACFDKLVMYSTFNYHPGSPEFFKVCEALPGVWKDQCLKRS